MGSALNRGQVKTKYQEQYMIEKDAQFWDKAAQKYAASPIADEAGFEKTLARTRALFLPHARVLELGCGTGTAALRLADAAESYLATDISAGMITIAQEKLEAARKNGFNASLDFRQAVADNLAVEGAHFDVVVAFSYLHLAGSLPVVLGHIRSLLAPGGLFISKTPCVGEMNRFIQLAIPLMRLLGKAPSVVTACTTASLTKQIAGAGFEILQNERHGTKKHDFRPFIVARAT